MEILQFGERHLLIQSSSPNKPLEGITHSSAKNTIRNKERGRKLGRRGGEIREREGTDKQKRKRSKSKPRKENKAFTQTKDQERKQGTDTNKETHTAREREREGGREGGEG